MRRAKRLALSRERLRNLTPGQLGRALGAEPNQSLNGVCNSLECDTLTFTNLTIDTNANTVNLGTNYTFTNNTLDLANF
jgi:hypothetical protein